LNRERAYKLLYKLLKAEMKKLLSSKYIILIYVLYIVLLIQIFREFQRPIKHDLEMAISVLSPFASGFLLYANLFGALIIVIASAYLCFKEYESNAVFIYTVFSKREYFLISKLMVVSFIVFAVILPSFFLGIIFDIIVDADFLNFKELTGQLLAVFFCTLFWGVFSLTLTLIVRNAYIPVVLASTVIFFEPVLHMLLKEGLLLKSLILFNMRGLLREIFFNVDSSGIIIVPYNPHYNSSFISFLILLVYLISLLLSGFCYVKREGFSK